MPKFEPARGTLEADILFHTYRHHKNGVTIQDLVNLTNIDRGYKKLNKRMHRIIPRLGALVRVDTSGRVNRYFPTVPGLTGNDAVAKWVGET